MMARFPALRILGQTTPLILAMLPTCPRLVDGLSDRPGMTVNGTLLRSAVIMCETGSQSWTPKKSLR
jgi:hypothetical protein